MLLALFCDELWFESALLVNQNLAHSLLPLLLFLLVPVQVLEHFIPHRKILRSLLITVLSYEEFAIKVGFGLERVG